jgi:hypothetical protein
MNVLFSEAPTKLIILSKYGAISILSPGILFLEDTPFGSKGIRTFLRRAVRKKLIILY